MPKAKILRGFKALTLLSVFYFSSASADPGLASLAGLLPFYVIALLTFLGIFIMAPVWLAFRARRLHVSDKLTRKKLIQHIAPVGTLGILGVIDFFTFPSYVSQFASAFYSYAGVVYYACLLVIIFFIYLAWSTYRKCRGVMAKI